MQEIEIKTWKDYSERVLNKRYKRFIFRGHTKGSYRLKTSLQRAFENLEIRKDWRQGREEEALKNFKSSAHLYLNHLPDKSKDLEWLSIMQHHGAPTRLLDWTYSPFVAAFFAFQEITQGCVVYEIDVKELENSNYSILPNNWKKRLMDRRRSKDFVAPYIPDHQNERLILQQGLFLVPSHISSDIEQIIGSYNNHDDFIKKYIFELKPREIRDAIKNLKAMNIDNYRLFPGIDGLSKSMYLRLNEPKQKF